MKIYTKKGDGGKTSIIGGERVSKADPRVEAYGSVDELNACLGAAFSLVMNEDLKKKLEPIQNDLMVICASIATPDSKRRENSPASGPESIARIEKLIDSLEEKLPPLKNFILPGGHPGAAALFLAATVCRRAERRIVEFTDISRERHTEESAYINRLSDLLFVAARHAALSAGSKEKPWRKG